MAQLSPSSSLTFVEVRCMDNFLINQRIKINTYFDSLINWDGVHACSPNKSLCSTNTEFWELNLMYKQGCDSISFYGWSWKSKYMKHIKKNQIVWLFWLIDYLVVFVLDLCLALLNTVRHLYKTGNRIIAMWPNTMSSLIVFHWPSLR